MCIRDRVKGVYVEINSIFDGTASAEILKKYERVIPTLQDMKELFGKLIRNRDAVSYTHLAQLSDCTLESARQRLFEAIDDYLSKNPRPAK